MFTLNSSITTNFDSLLLFTYGGPESMEDVAPFLDRVLEGKRISPERRAEVEKHYAALGGVSPMNRHTRELILLLRETLPEHEIHLPIYWGCRYSRPLVADTLREMVRDGFRRPLVFVPTPFGGYFGDEVYRTALKNAVREIGEPAFSWEKLPPFGEHPAFIAAQAEVLEEAISGRFDDDSAVVFTAHSIPLSADADDYSQQVKIAAKLVWHSVPALRDGAAFLAWQSAGGSQHKVAVDVPATENCRMMITQHFSAAGMSAATCSDLSAAWLSPSVETVLTRLSALGKKHVFLVPLGFPLENMEVVYDLDREAAEIAGRLGMTFHRVPTVGTRVEFELMVCEMVSEHVA